MTHMLRTRWAAIGAAVAVTVGVGGGFGLARATITSGERATFVPITPCRLFKTNAPTIGPRTTPLGADETVTFPVTGSHGNCAIPAGASAVVITLVGLNQTLNTFLTAYPADVAQPTAATMNLAGTATGATSSLATIKLSPTGEMKLFNKNGTVNVIADITGYYEDHDHDDRYYTETQINAMPSSSVIGGGIVLSDGTVFTNSPRFGAAWTAAKIGVGRYSLTFPGVNPGCAGLGFPLVLLSELESTPGSQVLEGSSLTQCVSGDMTVQVVTFNSAGVATDRAFMFVAYRPGNNQILPTSLTPALAPSTNFTECAYHLDARVECT